ncbi:FAD-binding domain-containing protein [Imleria badia]|nr:FAD-binding domain-containing protein [Imleria badia]
MSAVCLEIASSVSLASGVFFNGLSTEPYPKDISHFAVSSTQVAACSFEPGTAEDVGIALQILGRTGCSFAVKGGGHSLNPGFSSTSGVQIAMFRFADVTYDAAAQTATIGAGMIWDDVYAALEPYDVNVAGGRVSGIGVAGFTLGGGYSWHANQFGLTIDMVEAFQLVLPNGTVTNVNASQPDLFFALKGGFNNFGIVTHFTFKAFPQSQVWGGTLTYSSSQVDQLTKATAEFAANNTDPKANVLTSYGYFQGGGVSQAVNVAILFYDGPSPPGGLFDSFLTNNSNTSVFTRSFLSLVQSSDANSTWGLSRSAFNTISVLEYPEDFLKYMANQSTTWGTQLPLNYGYVTFNVEPVLPSVYNQTTSPSAWPGSRELSFSPLSIVFGWSGDGTTDDVMVQGIKESAANLRANTPVKEQLSLYGNYALADTPLEAMYGVKVERLARIKKVVDPKNVMGLAGGFKF